MIGIIMLLGWVLVYSKAPIQAEQPNTACTGRGYRPKVCSAVCKVWRDNV